MIGGARRFMDSEVELHEEIQTMNVLATQPQYYDELVRLNTCVSGGIIVNQ